MTKQPWWNNELQRLRNRLRKARKRYFRSKSEQHKVELRDLEGEYNSLRAQCFSCYIRRTEENIKDDPSTFWSFVRSRKQMNGIPQRVCYNGVTAETSLDSAHLFSSYFRSVLSENRSPSSEAYLDSLPRYDLNVSLFSFSTDDVLRKLQQMDNSKSIGPDRLSPFFILNCAASLSGPISMLYNLSMSEGTYP
ncbi:uncharacterized protein LOC134222490 [Armigeres subalbatus]|uniref:uncharacterized protein LOC134222490 n=1 Tax=Armigeres subalbatus TaxID=124917 RepID=UPI002ED2D905